MATFGTWAAKNTGNPELLLQGAEIIDSCNRMTRIINGAFGWIQPLSFYSYEHWVKSSEFYSSTIKAQVLAQNPELFIGKQVEFEFSPKTIEVTTDGRHLLTNGQIAVVTNSDVGLGKIKVKGQVTYVNGRYQIIQE